VPSRKKVFAYVEDICYDDCEFETNLVASNVYQDEDNPE